MRKNILGITALLILLFTSFTGYSQDEQPNTMAELGIDLTSAYVWRGVAFDNAPNMQAWAFFGYKNFTVGAWGTAGITSGYVEPNIWMSYSVKNASITITDIHGGSGNDFFNFKTAETTHLFDASLAYELTGKLPITATASVFFYGMDKKIESFDASGNPVIGADNNYSGYFELALPVKVNQNTIKFTAGVATHKSLIYATDGFGLVNLGAEFSKEIKVTDSFSLPISFALVANPDAKKVYTVFKISI